VFIFLTNNFDLPAFDIAQLYKYRWKIKLLFKCPPDRTGREKVTFKNKIILGQSENAVKTQVWIAVSVNRLVAIAKKKFMLKQSPYEIIQILSISIFEKMPIYHCFSKHNYNIS